MQSIRAWFDRFGRKRYPKARELTITADCGGSNGARVKVTAPKKPDTIEIDRKIEIK